MSEPPRNSDCPNPLHDWPLPTGYIAASDVAGARLRARWSNRECPECGLYGWAPGNRVAGTRPIHVPFDDVGPLDEYRGQ